LRWGSLKTGKSENTTELKITQGGYLRGKSRKKGDKG